MIQIDPSCPLKSISTFVKKWFQLLSLNRFEEACALLDEPNSYGIEWNRKRITDLLNETFCEGTIFREQFPDGPIFSDPFEIKEIRDFEVGKFADGSGYYFDYDIPLNGETSDLTAQFEFKIREKDYVVILHDLHVM